MECSCDRDPSTANDDLTNIKPALCPLENRSQTHCCVHYTHKGPRSITRAYSERFSSLYVIAMMVLRVTFGAGSESLFLHVDHEHYTALHSKSMH